MNQTIFTHWIKPRRFIAAAMAIFMSAYCALGAVYAVGLRAQTPLPLWSGQIALDVDPADGYEGEYVLIYNQSLNGRNVQSTGALSNIDIAPQSRRGYCRAGGREVGLSSGGLDIKSLIRFFKV